MKMTDLEKGTAAAAAAGTNDDEDYPLIRQQGGKEYIHKSLRNNKITTPSSSSSSLHSSRAYKRYSDCIILFLLITVVALITALVPVSQSRITITIATGSAAATNDNDANDTNDANNNKKEDEVLSVNEVLPTPESTIDEDGDEQPQDEHMHVDYHANRFDYSSAWCPNANCTGTPICFPCQRRWLIIVTVGFHHIGQNDRPFARSAHDGRKQQSGWPI
jgi:hypothetical protein